LYLGASALPAPATKGAPRFKNRSHILASHHGLTEANPRPLAQYTSLHGLLSAPLLSAPPSRAALDLRFLAFAAPSPCPLNSSSLHPAGLRSTCALLHFAASWPCPLALLPLPFQSLSLPFDSLSLPLPSRLYRFPTTIIAHAPLLSLL
jgi:hypothetical protein